MKLVRPTCDDKQNIMEYVQEHYDNGEAEIHASNMLTTLDYDKWIEKLEHDSTIGDIEWGYSDTYLVISGDNIVGMVNIRYNPAVEISEMYGHIGYGVRPSERRKGYATKILEKALILTKDKGLSEVILGCYEDNIGSKKTIEANNGKIYKKTMLADKPAVYYKIDL